MGVVNVWSLKEKISGMTFFNPNIPAGMSINGQQIVELVNKIAKYIKNYHQDYIISECGLVLDKIMPYIGASPDRLMPCSCCGNACIEINCPYSVNCTEPNE